MSSSPARIQLRAAAHVGPVIHDGHGFVGREINLLFRLLEARLLKRALADSGAELVLIVSDFVYQSLVLRYPSLVSPEVFRRVRVQVKKTRISAWACLPWMASQDTRCDIDQAITAFRIALARMDGHPGPQLQARRSAPGPHHTGPARRAGRVDGDSGHAGHHPSVVASGCGSPVSAARAAATSAKLART